MLKKIRRDGKNGFLGGNPGTVDLLSVSLLLIFEYAKHIFEQESNNFT